MKLWINYPKIKERGGDKMSKTNISGHLRKVPGRKAKVRVKGHRRKKG